LPKAISESPAAVPYRSAVSKQVDAELERLRHTLLEAC